MLSSVESDQGRRSRLQGVKSIRRGLGMSAKAAILETGRVSRMRSRRKSHFKDFDKRWGGPVTVSV